MEIELELADEGICFVYGPIKTSGAATLIPEELEVATWAGLVVKGSGVEGFGTGFPEGEEGA